MNIEKSGRYKFGYVVRVSNGFDPLKRSHPNGTLGVMFMGKFYPAFLDTEIEFAGATRYSALAWLPHSVMLKGADKADLGFMSEDGAFLSSQEIDKQESWKDYWILQNHS